MMRKSANVVLLFALTVAQTHAFQRIQFSFPSLPPSSKGNRMKPLNLVDPIPLSDAGVAFVNTSFSPVVDAGSFWTNSDVWVFIAGIIPFIWATIEFWRRIAVGEPFGTGSDAVIIGQDNDPASSRGSRVLGKDALLVAYFLFGISAAVVALVLYTVVTNESPPADFASAPMDAESSS